MVHDQRRGHSKAGIPLFAAADQGQTGQGLQAGMEQTQMTGFQQYSSNIKEWGQALGNSTITSDIVDRLFEGAGIINIAKGIR